MRLGFAALAFLLAVPASAQDHISAVTVATGYATGFGGGAVHSEIRLRAPVSAHVAVEPMLSWTRGFDYGERETCSATVQICTGFGTRSEGASELALGSAVTVRTETLGLPLGLDTAHAGVFVQLLVPDWGRQRLGAEIGTDTRLGRLVTVGADVQVAYFTTLEGDRERFSVSPLLRLAVGR